MDYTGEKIDDGRNESYVSTSPYRSEAIAVKADTPIMREYNELNKSLDVLGTSLADLRAKLDPVLGPERLNGAKDNAEQLPEPSLCAIASNMRSDRKQVDSMWAMVQDMLSRLEV